MNIQGSIKCDVLVIGTGIAGIRAAIEASRCGVKVVMVTKGKAGYNGSTFYPNTPLWGPNTVLSKEDEDVFYQEIMHTGRGAVNPKLAQIFTENTQKSIKWLDEIGFIASTCIEKPCFGEISRGICTKVSTIEGARKLLLHLVAKHDIEVIEDVFISDMVIKDACCIGAWGVDAQGEFIQFTSKATILATGGGESLWKYNSVTEDIEGNGYSLLLKEGAGCCNLEFIQFIPAFTHPFNKVHFVQTIIKEGVLLQNKYGENVLEKYLSEDISETECLKERAKHGPFSCEYESKYFDIAIHEECEKG